MCRIAGIVSNNTLSDLSSIDKMLKSMRRGGPDDEGIIQDGKVTFGHRRLSIIDLSEDGHQPMAAYQGELVITFNGEIYNYRRLRRELEALGCVFNSKTDTEVILHSYRTWGKDAFDKLEGIFAFVIHDKVRHTIVLVRDHIGVKPIYYSFLDNSFLFSSEVKAFKAFDQGWQENVDWKVLFLAFGSMPFPYTTLKDVFILKPGCWMEVDVTTLSANTGTFQHVRQFSKSQIEPRELIETNLRKALDKNLVSDAEIGVFLSGGIDSSLLSLLASDQMDLKTVSINFEQAEFDESKYQKMVLEKIKSGNHLSYTVTENMFWEHLDDIWCAMDQPSIDGVNTYFVSKYARQSGLKVVLSGLGADELFGGYDSFKRIKLLKTLKRIPLKKLLSKLAGVFSNAYKRIVYLSLPGAVGDYLFLRGIYTPEEIGNILNVKEEQVWSVLREMKIDVPNNLTQYQYASFLEIGQYMTNQLLRDSDFMGMWHGLEIRVPFLDIQLIRAMDQVEVGLWEKQSYPKQYLVEAFPNVLPDAVVHRRKQGFTFPISLWMKSKPSRFKDLLNKSMNTKMSVENFFSGKSHWSTYWSLAVVNQFK